MKINLIKHNGNLIPHSEEDRIKIDKFQDGAIYQTDIKNMDLRSLSQNRLIHQVCKNISEELNKAELKVNDVIKYETNWTMLKVKELLFKPVTKSLYGKESTTKLDKSELNLIFDTLIQALSTKGVDTDMILRESYD